MANLHTDSHPISTTVSIHAGEPGGEVSAVHLCTPQRWALGLRGNLQIAEVPNPVKGYIQQWAF